jgi:hypothetical protein
VIAGSLLSSLCCDGAYQDGKRPSLAGSLWNIIGYRPSVGFQVKTVIATKQSDAARSQSRYDCRLTAVDDSGGGTARLIGTRLLKCRPRQLQVVGARCGQANARSLRRSDVRTEVHPRVSFNGYPLVPVEEGIQANVVEFVAGEGYENRLAKEWLGDC